MKRLIFALIVAVAVNGSCSSGTSNINNGNTATDTVVSSEPNKAADMDKEAEREAEKWWQAAAEKCGDYHYITGDWIESPKNNPKDLVDRKGLFQVKDAHYVLEKYEKISESDKNRLGLEWWGDVTTVGSSHRVYDEAAKKWSEWRKGVPRFWDVMNKNEREILWARLERRRGQWQVVELGNPMKNVDCSKLPK